MESPDQVIEYLDLDIKVSLDTVQIPFLQPGAADL